MKRQLEDMTEPDLAELMRAMAKGVERAAAVKNVEKPHFVLLVFNDPAVAQYISNCRRSDMIAALRESADRLDSRQDVPR